MAQVPIGLNPSGSTCLGYPVVVETWSGEESDLLAPTALERSACGPFGLDNVDVLRASIKCRNWEEYSHAALHADLRKY